MKSWGGTDVEEVWDPWQRVGPSVTYKREFLIRLLEIFCRKVFIWSGWISLKGDWRSSWLRRFNQGSVFHGRLQYVKRLGRLLTVFVFFTSEVWRWVVDLDIYQYDGSNCIDTYKTQTTNTLGAKRHVSQISVLGHSWDQESRNVTEFNSVQMEGRDLIFSQCIQEDVVWFRRTQEGNESEVIFSCFYRTSKSKHLLLICARCP